MNYIVKSIFGASLIFLEIGFGTTLYLNDYFIWGFLNACVGGMVVYLLCLNYFKKEKK